MLRTCLIGCFVLLLVIPLHSQLQSHTDYAIGTNPYSVAVGDFNGDGNPDLAASNSGSNTVSILLGKGDGTFQSHVDYSTGSLPAQVVVADFNRDGKLDLATANGYGNSVSVLLGIGDGTFRPNVDYAAGQNPEWLAVADFNHDGYLDIATSNYGPDYSGGSVSIFLGNGDGTFQSQVAYPAGINPFGVMAGDFNRDGNIDLAVINNNGYYGVWILLGNGNGSFQPAVFYATGMNPRVGVVADFNSDGNLDLAIGNCIENNLSILFGDGAGHFASPVNYSAGAYVQAVAGGDFDGDGILDLVTSNAASNTVSVLKGNGNGTFQPNVDFVTGNGSMKLAVADLNHDKAPDLVVPNLYDNTVSVLLNKGTDFSISASAAIPAAVHPGQSSTSTLTLNLLTAFNNPATLACSVQPVQSAPTCSFSQNPLIFDASGNGTTILTINASSAYASLGFSSPGHDSRQLPFVLFPIAGLALVGAGFSFRRVPRRNLGAGLLGCLLLAGLIFQSACAGTSTVLRQPQTYTITVTATAGSAQHSTTTTLTVQ